MDTRLSLNLTKSTTTLIRTRERLWVMLKSELDAILGKEWRSEAMVDVANSFELLAKFHEQI